MSSNYRSSELLCVRYKIHGSRRGAKKGKAWELITRCGREVDVGWDGAQLVMPNKLESEFLTGQAEYS